MFKYRHLDEDCHRLSIERAREMKPPCTRCASGFTLDTRTRAVILASLDANSAMLRENGGGDDEDRYDQCSIDRLRDTVDVAPGLWALCEELPLALGSLHIALARGVGDHGGSDAVRAARFIESFWRHLDASEACAATVELIALREVSYPKAVPIERIAPGLLGMPTDEAIRRLAAQAGIGDGGPLPIHGIEVTVGDRQFRGHLRAVLDRIGHRYPNDLDRIRSRVSRIAYFGSAETCPGIAACYGDDIHGAPEHIPGPDGIPSPAAWPIRVSRSLVEEPRDLVVAVIVHELGHAACTPDDIEVRSVLGAEWGHELAADHFATKWGFRMLIDSMRPNRSVAHHGPLPGEQVLVRFGPHELAWHVTGDRVLVREDSVQ